MKIAITSKGKDLDAQVDPRFGRAAFIIIVDTESLDFEAVDNSENVNSFKGAGIQAAASIHDKGAEILLTGFCGPNAFKTLDAAKVKVIDNVEGTVHDAIEKFNRNEYSFADTANVEGHW